MMRVNLKLAQYRDSHYVHFTRKSTNGTQTISIGGGHLAPYLSPRISLCVSDHLVEKIYSPFGTQADMPKAWEHNTLVSRLLLGAEGFSSPIFRYQDFEKWSDQVIDLFSRQGIAILEELDDRSTTERLFNDLTIDTPEYLSSYSDHIACRGLILAKLLGREDIQEIAAYHHKHLATLLFETSYLKLESFILNIGLFRH